MTAIFLSWCMTVLPWESKGPTALLRQYVRQIGASPRVGVKIKNVGNHHQDNPLIEITLPETNGFAPENGWLEYDPFLFGARPIFRCEMLVSGRVSPCRSIPDA